MSVLATTKLSSKGQVVIPEEIRKKAGLKSGDQFIVLEQGRSNYSQNTIGPTNFRAKAITQKSKKRGKSCRNQKKGEVRKYIKKIRSSKWLLQSTPMFLFLGFIGLVHQVKFWSFGRKVNLVGFNWEIIEEYYKVFNTMNQKRRVALTFIYWISLFSHQSPKYISLLRNWLGGGDILTNSRRVGHPWVLFLKADLKFMLQRSTQPLASYPITFNKPVSRDPDDDKFLSCALVSGSKFLVSGDKDLLILDQHFDQFQIVSSTDFLKQVANTWFLAHGDSIWRLAR